MGNLTTCLKKVGDRVSEADKALILARARELRTEGMTPTEAAIRVVRGMVSDLRSEQRAPRSTAARDTHPKTVMGSRYLAALSSRLGGLDPAWLSEFSTRFEIGRMGKDGRPVIQWRNPMIPGVGKLFRKGGTQDLQQLAEVAEEMGYLEPGAVERDTKEAGEAAKDMVRAALDRKELQTAAERQAEQGAAQQSEREAYYRELDDESAREAEAEREAIQAEAGMTARQADAIEDDDLWDAKGTTDTASVMRALGFTDREIADELDAEAQAQVGTQGATDGRAQAGAAEAGQNAGAAAGPVHLARDAAPRDGPQEGLTLESQTAADLQAKVDREEAATTAIQRKRAAEQEQLRKEAEARDIKARADQTVGDFQLGQSAQDQLSGMGDLFAEPNPKPKPSSNTIFTDDAAEKARALLKRKLGQVSSGIDPELMQAGITLAGYHIEKGARSFAAYARAMLADLGEVVRPYLKSWYMAAKYDPRMQAMPGMSGAAEVETANVDDISAEADNAPQEAADVRNPDANLERDRSDAGVGDAAVGAAVQGKGSADGAAAPRGRTGSSRRGRPSDPSLPADGAAAARELGDQPVHRGDRADGPAEFDAGGRDGERSDDPGFAGVQPEAVAAGQVASAAVPVLADAAKRSLQREADSRPVTPGDLENIRATLPYLLPGQQEDVHKAEQRFAKPDGYGMLFTNGTGTGKTFSGLGVIKRFARQGKTDTLIVVPDAKIMADWVASGRALDLTINPLVDTKDSGRGITITTYANLGQNDELARRRWDLVVPDEAHSLMQAAEGDQTLALNALRAISMHPRGALDRFSMLNRDDIARRKDLGDRITANEKIRNADDTMDVMRDSLAAENKKLQAQWDVLHAKLEAEKARIKAEVEAAQGEKRTRVAALSATPFAYEKTVDWAEGYLFDYGKASEEGRSYNRGDAREQFFMQHFGYRMRFNKLTEPDAKVDRGLLQRQFNGWLKKSGSLSGRSLDVEADYDRRFVLVDSAVGNQIDSAMDWIDEQQKAAFEAAKKANRETDPNGWSYLRADLDEALYGKLGHLTRRYLLEAIKAKEVIPHIREHLAMGRKVVVFHDFKKGGATNPFEFEQRSVPADADPTTAKKIAAYNQAAAAFRKQFPELAGDALLSDLISPIERFTAAFPDVLLINGDQKERDLLARYKAFQDDGSGPLVALVQSDKNKGWSGHDTTGKHPRVLFNLGLPTQPTKTIQQEGRIYRTGQVSNAMFRYLNTGTNWERWAFAQTIAERASAAENLGAGEQARALKDAFIAGFEESSDFRAGHEGEGTGGKARDAAANNALTEFDRAKAFYWGTQKKDSRTKAQEGADYFATPEPLGLKMVQWADVRSGEDALEPSAGHGAIARWLGEKVNRTAIEPSNTLGSRLAMVFDGKIIRGDFEDLHVNNKFDGVVMNPPFGTAGRTAIDHLDKAATHLREGGRIVALIPTGPAADAKFEKWFEDEKGSAKGLHLVADIKLPGVTFERAGTQVRTRVVVVEKPINGQDAPQQVNRDLSDIADINELFGRLEDMDLQPRAKPVEPEPFVEPEAAPAAARKVEKAQAQQQGAALASDAGIKVVEHTTQKGKVIKGVIRTDLTKEQAQSVDPYTWKKDGGFFIRLEHLAKLNEKFPAAKADDQPQLSQAEGGKGVAFNDLQRMVSRIAADWSGRDRMHVVATATDLPANIANGLRSMNALGTTRGLRMPKDGSVYLVADKLGSMDEAQFVLFHEVYGHEGLRAFLGDGYVDAMAKLRVANPKLSAEANRWQASYGRDQIEARIDAGMSRAEAEKEVRALAVEEALADRAGAAPPPNGWKALMAKLQAALRRIGLNLWADKLEAMTEAETHQLLMNARRAVETGAKATPLVGAAVPATSRDTPDGGIITVQKIPYDDLWVVSRKAPNGSQHVGYFRSEAEANDAAERERTEVKRSPGTGSRWWIENPAEPVQSAGGSRLDSLGRSRAVKATLDARAQSIRSRAEGLKLEQLPDRAGFCFKLAAEASAAGIGDMVIGRTENDGDPLWHSVVMRDGMVYDPTFARWFEAGVYEDLGFAASLTLTPDAVRDYIAKTGGKAPDARNQGLGDTPPVLSRKPPPPITVRRTENGAPTFEGLGITLDYPLQTERFEVIPGPGQQVLNYPIMPADGFDVLGHVELLIEDGWPVSLLDIEVNSKGRAQGVGRKVIETLLAADQAADLNISNIVEAARGFWAKMGVPEQPRGTGEAYDGTLNWQTYSQAQASDGRSAGRAALGARQADQGARRQPDAGAEGRRAEAQGRAPVDVVRAGEEALPVLSQAPPGPTGSAVPGATPAEQAKTQSAYKRRVNSLLTRVDHVVNGLGGLPDTDQFLAQRYRALGKIAAVDEVAGKIREAFRKASADDKKAIYGYLTDREFDPAQIADGTVREMAKSVKGYINKVGDQLVDHGLLNAESREEYRDRYLPRLYLSHLLDEGQWRAIGAGKKVSDMGYLKRRKDIPQEIRDVLLGEIKDPAFLAGVAIAKPMRDMALLDWLQEISGNDQWVFPKSLAMWEGKRVSVYWLKAEAAALRTRARHYPETVNRDKATAIADRMEALADQTLGEANRDHADFKRIPDTPQYGRLRGLLVRKEIHNDLMGTHDMLPKDMNWAQSLFGYGGIGTKATGLWKASKVSLNIPGQIRNIISNGVSLQLSGVPLHMFPAYLSRAIKQVRLGGKHWQVAKKYGVTESTFSAQEVFRAKRDMLDLERDVKGLTPLVALKTVGAWIMDKSSDAYQFSEALFKTMKIMDAMEREGLGEAEAAIEAQKWLFDYSLLDPNIRYLRNAPIGAPFLTYTTKILPRLAEVALLHPQRFLPWVGLSLGIQMLAQAQFGGDDEEWKKLKQALPKWMHDKPNVAFLPFRDDAGRLQAMDLSYFFPWSQWSEFGINMAKGELGDAMKNMGVFGGPITEVITAMKTGRDSFTGREIVNPGDPTIVQAQSLIAYAWDLAMPPMMSSHGVVSPLWAMDPRFGGKLAQAATGSTNKYGDERATLGQAAARLVGANVYGVDPDVTRQINVLQLQADVKKVEVRLKQLMGDHGLSPETRKELTKQYMAEYAERHKKLAKYAEESKVPAFSKRVKEPATTP